MTIDLDPQAESLYSQLTAQNIFLEIKVVNEFQSLAHSINDLYGVGALPAMSARAARKRLNKIIKRRVLKYQLRNNRLAAIHV